MSLQMNPLNEHFHSPPLPDYISLKIRFKKINEHVVSVRTFKSKGKVAVLPNGQQMAAWR